MDPYGHIYDEDDTETRETLQRSSDEMLEEDKKRLLDHIEEQANKTRKFATSIRTKKKH